MREKDRERDRERGRGRGGERWGERDGERQRESGRERRRHRRSKFGMKLFLCKRKNNITPLYVNLTSKGSVSMTTDKNGVSADEGVTRLQLFLSCWGKSGENRGL